MFVLLWASGFIGAKLGLPYAEPMTFLAVRMTAVVLVLGTIILITRPAWPSRLDTLHSVVTGLFVHGCYLGGVFVAIDHKLPAGFAALVVSLQPILTSTLANRLLGERVMPQQWLGLALGVAGVYLVVHGHVEGDAPPIAWLSATVALIGMTIGTIYQKRFGDHVTPSSKAFAEERPARRSSARMSRSRSRGRPWRRRRRRRRRPRSGWRSPRPRTPSRPA